MNDKRSWVILLIVLIIVVVAGLMIFGKGGPGALVSPTPTVTTEGDLYQAVFLVNNQVYFGHLSQENSQFAVLKDIYYLQVNQPIQPLSKGQTAQPEINLVKLGGELHGPTDEMKINRDQILLIEDLRADSNLVKAIENYKANQAKAAAQ